MARGTNYGSFYVNSSPDGDRVPSIGVTSIAELVLTKNKVPFTAIGGDALTGYDIKSQDSVSMLKLSLLAEGEGQVFKEVYCKPDGQASVVEVGVTEPQSQPRNLISSTSTGQFVNKIDHVLIKPKQPLPIRYHAGTVNVMGAGQAEFYQFQCPIGTFSKNLALKNEAWAAFERSQQSEETQDLLKELVRRSEWEQLVGYKLTFQDIPNYASFSPSQTTPKAVNLPISNVFDGSFDLFLGTSFQDEGGVIDISGLNAVGAPVLDIARGSELAAAFPGIFENDPTYGVTDNDFYVLLSNECSIYSVSRGQNWFLVQNGSTDSATVILKGVNTSEASFKIFYGAFSTTNYFRTKGTNVTSLADAIRLNIENQTGTIKVPFPPLSPYVENNPLRNTVVIGLAGNDKGFEMSELQLAYTIAKPSIQIRSPHGDAPEIAAGVAAGGVFYDAIVVKEEPAPTAWNGTLVYPPKPPDEEGEKFDADSEIDELEGSVIDIQAGWASAEQAKNMSSNIYQLINGDSGSFKSYVFESGGYGILPGMLFEGGVVNTVDFTYGDKDSVTTNITTGPTYYPIGSYSDSYYVKRSETITRNASVVAGSNRDGIFVVDVEGKGVYEAINGLLQPIYPGDRVEVRLINVPTEI